MAAEGFLLCGVAIALPSGDTFMASLTGLSGLGASVATDDATTNANAAGWGEVFYSCIARLKPFTVSVQFSGNKDWVTKLKAAAGTLTLTWPVEDGHSAGGTLTFKAKITDFTVTGQLENRTMAEITITPTGAPTWAAGAT